MDFPQQRGTHFPENADATDALESAIPSSYRCPVLGQPHGHAGVVRDAMFPLANAGDHWADEIQNWNDIPPPVENNAAQGQQLQFADMGYYNMANDQPPLRGHRDPAINNYAGVALDVPSEAQAAPQDPIDIFEGPALNAAADPAQAFVNELHHQGPVVNRPPANELLRQLAILYLHEPNSQIAAIRMEPGQAHGVRVNITLELH